MQDHDGRARGRGEEGEGGSRGGRRGGGKSKSRCLVVGGLICFCFRSTFVKLALKTHAHLNNDRRTESSSSSSSCCLMLTEGRVKRKKNLFFLSGARAPQRRSRFLSTSLFSFRKLSLQYLFLFSPPPCSLWTCETANTHVSDSIKRISAAWESKERERERGRARVAL